MKLKNKDTTMDEALGYDASTGCFMWKVDCGAARAGQKAGRVQADGYLMIGFKGKKVLAHRLAWFFVHGSWPHGEIDHIDGDKANNRIDNLRIVSRSQNMQNMKVARKDNQSGFLGVVSPKKGSRYLAQLIVGGRRVFRKSFGSAEEAHAAYLEAKRRHHDGCTI